MQTCHACQARNMPTKPTKAPLKPYTVGVPMERIQMDIIGPLPETRSGNKYVLTITCCFTKWTESYPLKNITAEAVIPQYFTVNRIIHLNIMTVYLVSLVIVQIPIIYLQI